MNNYHPLYLAAALTFTTLSITSGCAVLPSPPATELAEEASADYEAMNQAALEPLDHSPNDEPDDLDDQLSTENFMPPVPEIEPVVIDPLSFPDDDETTETLSPAHDETITENQESAPDNSLWPRLRAGFALPDYDHARVKRDLHWYAKHQQYLDRTFERATPYLHYIVEEVERRNMPMEIALLPVVESAFQPSPILMGAPLACGNSFPAPRAHTACASTGGMTAAGMS